ncbi:MAG: hypothetical protein WCJ19_05620 [bacterium]
MKNKQLITYIGISGILIVVIIISFLIALGGDFLFKGTSISLFIVISILILLLGFLVFFAFTYKYVKHGIKYAGGKVRGIKKVK